MKLKCALDIGNSAVKGMLLSEDNKVIAPLRFPSGVVTIPDAKYLNYHHDTDIYLQVLDSPLEHYEDIVAVGQKAIDMPDYKEFDVTSTSYKANHRLTTSLLFGAIAPYLTEDVAIDLAVSVPIVEAKSIGLIDDYKQLLTGEHLVRIYKNKEANDYKVTFTQVTVLNEGQAGFLGLLDNVDNHFRNALMMVYSSLGEDKDPVSDFEDFLIVDIGEGTTDLAVFRNKKFNPDYSYSITKGYGNLLEDAIANAARENLTIESRKELQKVLESTNKRRQSRKELWQPYVEPTKQQFIEDLTDTVLKTYGSRDYFDAIIFIGGGFTALTGYTVDFANVSVRDNTLFEVLTHKLTVNNKHVDLLFGVPGPYAQGINERGLTQVLINR